MAFSKKNFVDNQTVIDADTLNAIQDELIRVAGLLGKDIQSAAINDSGHLILTLTDGAPLDAGIAKGDTGAGMDITGATVGQIAKISAVDDNGVPTAWETIDGYTGQVSADKLTNPDHPTDLVQYAAFQAAVPMVQQMGIFGATVGQIIKVKDVNSDGCPTAWEPVDMPSAGSETMNLSWKHIRDVELTPDAIEAIVSTTDAGNTFSYDEIMLELIPNLAGYFYVRASQSVNLSANVAMWVTNSKYTQMHLGLLGKKLAITSASRTDGSLGFSNNYGGNGDIDKISTIVFGASASVGAAFTVKIWGR